ncbi:MAG: YceI family protein, partial [Polaribacter sp.]
MRKVILSFALIASVLTACKSEKKDKVATKEAVKVAVVADLNNVDVANSVVTWKGSKPTESHDGTIMLKEGSLNLEAG